MLRSEGVVLPDGLFMLVEGAGFDPPLDEVSAGPFLISGPVAGLPEVCACVNPIAPTTATVLIIETTNLDAFMSILLPVWLVVPAHLRIRTSWRCTRQRFDAPRDD